MSLFAHSYYSAPFFVDRYSSLSYLEMFFLSLVLNLKWFAMAKRYRVLYAGTAMSHCLCTAIQMCFFHVNSYSLLVRIRVHHYLWIVVKCSVLRIDRYLSVPLVVEVRRIQCVSLSQCVMLGVDLSDCISIWRLLGTRALELTRPLSSFANLATARFDWNLWLKWHWC